MVATGKGIAKYGLRSMEIFYLPVKEFHLGTTYSYITQLRINDPDSGVIVDDAFMPVAERTVVSEKITDWLANNLFADIQRFKSRGVDVAWYSLYIPVRILIKDSVMDLILENVKQADIDYQSLCFSFDNKILYEDHNDMALAFSKLKGYGISTMINDFGDEFSPVSRIASLKPDYVRLSPSVTTNLMSDDMDKVNAALSVYGLLNTLEVKTITSSVNDEEAMSMLPEQNTLYTGKLAGGYRKPRSVR